MVKKKPFHVHAKAFVASATLLVIALGFSWALPFVHVKCMRVDDRVEFVMQQNMLGLITYNETTVHDLKSVKLEIEFGTGFGDHQTTDACYLQLSDSDGDESRIMLGTGRNISTSRSDALVERIDAVLDSSESSMSSWFVSWISYTPLLPAAMGILFMSLVTWDFIVTRLFGTE